MYSYEQFIEAVNRNAQGTVIVGGSVSGMPVLAHVFLKRATITGARWFLEYVDLWRREINESSLYPEAFAKVSTSILQPDSTNDLQP